MRAALWNTQMLARKAGEKGGGKLLSQELEILVPVLILSGTIYGGIKEPPIAVLGGRKVSNPTSPL